MIIGIYSQHGAGAMLVQSLQCCGHQVIFHVAKNQYEDVFDGLVIKAPDFQALRQSDIVFVDDNGHGVSADFLKKQGYTVWGGGVVADKLEHDRIFGMKTMAQMGIPIPETFEISSLADAKSVAKKEFDRNEKLVIKISGEAGAGSSMSFVAQDREQLLAQLAHWDEEGLMPSAWEGIIQKFVSGIEVSVEGWWTGEKFLFPNITVEEKKFMTGGLGPAVGCASNIVVKIDPSSRLFQQMVAPMGAYLKKVGYVGQMDVNTIVGPDGPRGLEFTPRPGYHATPTLAWGHPGGYGALLCEALGMECKVEAEAKPGPYWAGIGISIPPHPFEHKSESFMAEVYGCARGTPLTLDDEENFYAYDVMLTDGGLVCAGTTGIIGVALGGGSTPREAGLAAYKVAENMQIPNKQYRSPDAFDRASKDIPELVARRLIRISP